MWIQRLLTKQVLQSTTASLLVRLEMKTMIYSAKIYPNPVNNYATVAFNLGSGNDFQSFQFWYGSAATTSTKLL